MSVINQMLHDLENRRSQMMSTDNSLYNDLNFVPKLSSSNKFETVIYVVLFGIILAGVILFFIKINTHYLNPPVLISKVIDESVASPVMKNSNKLPQDVIDKKNTSTEKPTEYEVATSLIHKQDKVVITKIPAKKTVKTRQLAHTKAVTKKENNEDGVVHKRRRELSAPQKAENLYQSAYESLLANKQKKAQEDLRNALMLLPGHNKSRELLAGIYIKNGQIVEARILLQYGMRISPSHFIFAKLYARILMDMNDNVTAISVLLRNPPSQKTDVDYFGLLAALYQKNKQHHKAATLYSQLLKQRENYGVWWLGMAISLEALGNQEQARMAYEKAKNSGNLSKGLYQYTDQRVAALEEIEYP